MATDLLVSFHVVLILCAIVLAAGTGVWALLSHRFVLAAISLLGAAVLILYREYFEKTAERTGLD